VIEALSAAEASGEEVARRLDEDGYVAVSGLMTPGELAAARADLARVLASQT